MKVLSPEIPVGSSRGHPFVRRQQGATRNGERAFLSRDLRPDRASKHDRAVPREIHQAARRECVHRVSSLVKERLGGAWWKSEAPVVAVKPGNAGGAKGGPEGDGADSRHGPDAVLEKS